MPGSRPRLLAPAILGLALACAGRADADVIALSSTGVDDSGAPLAGGSADPHWTIVDGPGIASPTPGLVLDNQLVGTYAQAADSRWIWVNADGSGATAQPYTFRLTFDLAGYDPSTATISGSWGVDNNGSINLNGSAADGSGELTLDNGSTGNFLSLHDFAVTGGFVSGLNTLDVLAEDDGNPGALNVSDLRLTATPQAVPGPASALMLGVGSLAAIGLARRRARASATPRS